MLKILFVWHGNICRSPMAEYVLKDMVRRQHLVNILVKRNHLSGELETVCPGRRKPIYMWRSRCPEDADLQDSCRQVVKFIRSFPDSNHTPLS